MPPIHKFVLDTLQFLVDDFAFWLRGDFVGKQAFEGTCSSVELAQLIDGPARGDHSQPARQRGAVIASEFTELKKIVLDQRSKYLLEQSFREVWASEVT